MLRHSLKMLLLAICFFAVMPEAFAQAPAGGCVPVVHRNWSGCIAGPGVAIPFCTKNPTTGAQSVRYLTQQGYDALIANGTIVACGATPSCTQATQFQNLACPSGQVGTITQSRIVCQGGVQGNDTAWTTISNTCGPCTQGTETTTTRTQCPAGQTGVITEQRTTNTGGVCGAYGNWTVISNTCTPTTCTPGTETRTTTPCPQGQTGVITEQRTTNTGGVCGVFGNWTVTSNTCTTGLVCTTPWGQQLNNGQSVTAYYRQNVGSQETCVSETRTCNNGNLSGSYEFQSCSQTCNTGTEDRTLPCPTGETGVGIIERRTTNVGGQCGVNGAWTEVTRACEPIVCALPWGGQILYGQSVTAYQASSATQCNSQTRTCGLNGQLSGTYQYQSCTTTCTPTTETRTSTPCPSGQTGVITETRTLNQNSVCGNHSAWTVQSNTCQPQVSTCDIVLQAGNHINLNLYQLAQEHQCPIVPGVRVTLTILEGATIGSNSHNFASFTTGTGWPSNTTLRVINRGRILGKGGDGAYAYFDQVAQVRQAQAGGPAVDAPYPMTFDNSDGEVWGGGGGGGTISFAHCSPAGGGGAGYVIGNTFIPNMECTVSGSSSREGKRLNGEIATRTQGAGNEYMIRQIGTDVNAAYYVSGPGGHPGQAGGNAAFYVRQMHVAGLGSPSTYQDIMVGYYYYTPTQIGSTAFDTGALIGGDAGYAIINQQNVTWVGADNGDRRGKDYPTVPPRRPTPHPPLTDLQCTPTTETTTTRTACPQGQTGVITEQRTVNVGSVCGQTSNWTVISNTCQQVCTQGTETRNTTPCPTGETGVITETRTTNVNGQCGVFGNWTVTSNTCQPTTSNELVLLLAKVDEVDGNGNITKWSHYPYCTDYYAAIGMEYNPNLPYKVDVVLVTGSQNGQLGYGCGATGNTGRLKFAEIPLTNVTAGNNFTLTAKFVANIRGCGFAGSVDHNGNAKRTVTLAVDRTKYSTSYVDFVYTQQGVRITGDQAANAVISQIPCIPYADFTGKAAAGLFGLCSQAGTQTGAGYVILAEKNVQVN